MRYNIIMVKIPAEHIKHHSKKHIALMRKLMKKGMSFKGAHTIAKRADMKGKKKKVVRKKKTVVRKKRPMKRRRTVKRSSY